MFKMSYNNNGREYTEKKKHYQYQYYVSYTPILFHIFMIVLLLGI